MKSFKMIIRTDAARGLNAKKKIQLAPGEPNQPASTQKYAEKMIRACGENVRFLNQQLQSLNEYMKLPPLQDNVLYLAYTIEIKESAPFSAEQLRRHLKEHGIESAPEYRFLSQTGIELIDLDLILKSPLSDSIKPNKFCIPCHLGLTILDLEQIVEAFDTFFKPIIDNSVDNDRTQKLIKKENGR